jgi:hypothetical protein
MSKQALKVFTSVIMTLVSNRNTTHIAHYVHLVFCCCARPPAHTCVSRANLAPRAYLPRKAHTLPAPTDSPAGAGNTHPPMKSEGRRDASAQTVATQTLLVDPDSPAVQC